MKYLEVLGVNRRDRKRNNTIREELGVDSINKKLKKKHLIQLYMYRDICACIFIPLRGQTDILKVC